MKRLPRGGNPAQKSPLKLSRTKSGYFFRSSYTLKSKYWRETVTFDLNVAPHGEVVDSEIRLTRHKCKKALYFDEADEIVKDPEHEYHDDLRTLQEAASAMRSYRVDNGLLLYHDVRDLNVESTRDDLILPIQNSFELVISELMSQINIQGGKFLAKWKAPALYRPYDDVAESFEEALKGPLGPILENNPVATYLQHFKKRREGKGSDNGAQNMLRPFHLTHLFHTLKSVVHSNEKRTTSTDIL